MADQSIDRSAAKTKNDSEIVALDLPAPLGWQKKFMPKKGGTPRRNEIVFISPTGEEIKTKKQLDKYLKSHPGGTESSEFDWGTGDTPRRSARLSEMAKAEETPEDEKPKKRGRKSSSKKEAEDEDNETEASGKVSADIEKTPEVEKPKKRGRKSSSKKGAGDENNETEEAGKVSADIDKTEAEETPEDEKPKKRGRKSSSKKGAGDENNETEEAAKVSADVDMAEADKNGDKVEGEDAAVNKDGNVDVAFTDGTAVWNEIEGVREGAFDQDSENKNEDYAKEIPVESKKGAGEHSETEEAGKVSADVDMTEADKTGDKVEGEDAAVNKDGDLEVAVTEGTAVNEIEGVGEGAFEHDSENKNEEDVKEIPLESKKGAGDESSETEEAGKVSTDIDMTEADKTGEKVEGEDAAVNKDGDFEVEVTEVTAVENEKEGVGEGAFEQDSENKNEEYANVIPLESKKGAGDENNETEEAGKVSVDVDMTEADKTGEKVEGEDADVNEEGNVEVVVTEGTAIENEIEGVGEGGAFEQDSETKNEEYAKEIPVESTDKSFPEGAMEQDSENKIEGAVKEIPADSTDKNFPEDAIEQDSGNKIEGDAKENVEEDASKADAGASNVIKDQKEANTSPTDTVASFANNDQKEEDANPTEAVASYVHKDQEEADSNPTDTAASYVTEDKKEADPNPTDAAASHVTEYQKEEGTNPTDAAASYVTEDKKESDSNPTDAAASFVHEYQKEADTTPVDSELLASDLDKDVSALNGENERKELPENFSHKDNEETSVAKGNTLSNRWSASTQDAY